MIGYLGFASNNGVGILQEVLELISYYSKELDTGLQWTLFLSVFAIFHTEVNMKASEQGGVVHTYT